MHAFPSVRNSAKTVAGVLAGVAAVSWSLAFCGHGILPAVAGVASGVIGLVGYFPCIRDTLRRRIRPAAVSWLIWALLGIVSLTGQTDGGAGFGAVVTACTVAGCLAVAVVTVVVTGLAASMKAMGRLDWACLAGAVAALALLCGTPDPTVAVILSNAIGLAGFLPTVAKTIKDPGSEGIAVYVWAAAKFALAAAALPHWDLLTALYPALCLAEELAMIALIMFARHGRQRHPISDTDGEPARATTTTRKATP